MTRRSERAELLRGAGQGEVGGGTRLGACGADGSPGRCAETEVTRAQTSRAGRSEQGEGATTALQGPPPLGRPRPEGPSGCRLPPGGFHRARPEPGRGCGQVSTVNARRGRQPPARVLPSVPPPLTPDPVGRGHWPGNRKQSTGCQAFSGLPPPPGGPSCLLVSVGDPRILGSWPTNLVLSPHEAQVSKAGVQPAPGRVPVCRTRVGKVPPAPVKALWLVPFSLVRPQVTQPCAKPPLLSTCLHWPGPWATDPSIRLQF